MVKKKVIFTTEPVDLDRSVECAACEAFATVFDDHINNNSNSLNIENIDMAELCDEVEIVHKDQVITMIVIFAGTMTYFIQLHPILRNIVYFDAKLVIM